MLWRLRVQIDSAINYKTVVSQIVGSGSGIIAGFQAESTMQILERRAGSELSFCMALCHSRLLLLLLLMGLAQVA